MKLRVVELLLISTIPAMALAERGLPPLGITVATLLGGTLAAGSANAFNQVIEKDLDELMQRTKRRPLVEKQVTSIESLIFATLIGILALSIFWIFTTPLATFLTFFIKLNANSIFSGLLNILPSKSKTNIHPNLIRSKPKKTQDQLQ